MTDKQAFDYVEALVKQGALRGFAENLIRNGRRFGLSDEQFWWIHRLANPEPLTEISANNIAHRFNLAYDNGVKVKNLRVRFPTAAGEVQLSYAGPRSQHFRTIWVTDLGEYPDNKLYGKIDANTLTFTGKSPPPEVVTLIKELNDIPTRLPW